MKKTLKTILAIILLFSFSVTASAIVTWSKGASSGYYIEDGIKFGLMRYFFNAQVDGEITQSGIKFIKSETDDTQVGKILSGIPAKTFYGDITDIPEGISGTYFAKGFVVVDGTTYWSDPLGCTPNFTREMSKNDTTNNYAIILQNFYDPNTDAAYVRLGFADGTVGAYEVGKFYTYGPNSPYNDVAQDFALADLTDTVVSYNIMDNGKVDLSAHDLIPQDIYGNYDASGNYAADIRSSDTVGIVDGKLGGFYGYSEDTLLFVRYTNGVDEKVKTYKLSKIISTNNDIKVSYLLNTASSTANNKCIVAAGTSCELSNINYDYESDDNIAYVVYARQLYNSATDEFYAQLALIDENGLFTAKTLDAVTDDQGNQQIPHTSLGISVGKISELQGAFVRYEINDDDMITMLDLNIDDNYAPNTTTTGYMWANIAASRSDIVFFYTGWEDFTGDPIGAKYAEDGCTIVAIDDEEYVGDRLYVISKREEGFESEAYNAILFFNKDGRVKKIFSFSELR